MAKFIGSNLHSDNWGEDCLIEKLVEYFDDSYVIYRNRMVFGAQFDVCLLAPGIGIVIFEVKAWKPQTIKEVINGDTIVIQTHDSQSGEEKEALENPTAQARGYVYKMRSKIRQKTGKTPLIYDMVCFPNLTKSDYDNKGLEPVCEYDSTLLKEDLESKEAFFRKMELCRKNHQGALKHSTEFSNDVMYRVRQIFETDLRLEDESVENTDVIKDAEPPQKSAYSLLAYIPQGKMDASLVGKISSAYAAGTKLYVITEDRNDLRGIYSEILNIIRNKGLAAYGTELKIDFTGSAGKPLEDETSFQVFNCAAFCVSPLREISDAFVIEDGKGISHEQERLLNDADRSCNFNFEQYRIEHADKSKNIMVKAGAGTGKTFTMISRIAYLCHVQGCSMKDMSSRIVMITFTNDAADQMRNKIRQYFSSYYLLTGDSDCLAFINQIEGMQISTIHSYAKKMISALGIELGYGQDLSVTASDFRIKQIISDETNSYIKQKQDEEGPKYIQELGMPVYLINRHILNIISRLHNQSVNVSALKPENFGDSISGGENGEFHRLIQEIVPKVEDGMDSYLKKENKIHLSNMMSTLQACLGNDRNKERLLKMQSGRPQFMFVDEFQDTDDVQIDAIRKIAELQSYKLFVVGDVKQCIYRFRGAKEDAFNKLGAEQSPEWNKYSLYKNYRTDRHLLDIFHETFSSLGNRTDEDGEQLLNYDSSGSSSDRLVGTKEYNAQYKVPDFYRKITICSEDERIPQLFDEVQRQIGIIQDQEHKGKRLSDSEKEVAILVRENWQAEEVKKEGKKRGIEVITNTGGDLYKSAPALDMLILANALLHYDEPDYLYAFVSSNFIIGHASKSGMYHLHENGGSQSKELQGIISNELSRANDGRWNDWIGVVRALRFMPILQVIRKIYEILMPWNNYGGKNKWKRDNYRLNADLLIEELINTANMNSLSINSMVDILAANIASSRNVDSRTPDVSGQDYVVRCVTVHKAKGLEYGAVILPYCSAEIDRMKRSDINVSVINDGTLKIGYMIKADNGIHQNDRVRQYAPRSSRSDKGIYQNDLFDINMETNERMREETRILYVAMTRAIRDFSWIALDGRNCSCWQELILEHESDAV